MLQVCWGRDCMQTTDCTTHSPRHTSSKQAKRKKSSSSLEKAMLLSFSIVILASLSQIKASSAPCYDRQDATYKTQFDPTECNVECTVTPFFSPDHSVSAYVSVIKAAAESIDVLEPDFKSWGGCTSYKSECGGQCIGCTVEDQASEPFPVFTSLMNALHSSNDSLKIRLLTNNFAVPTCSNLTTPIDWMYLNGVAVKNYKTTTFQHAKFMIIDGGKKVLISSVNFSKTSFTRNREAGVILNDCKCPLIDFYQKVFDSDWETGYDYKLSTTYSKDNKDYITSNKQLPFSDMGPYPVPGAFVTDMPNVEGVTVVSGYTAPDNARDTFMKGLDSAQNSLIVHIYQITDDGICDKILELYKNGVNVTLLVGSYIVSYIDYKRSQECYCKLYKGGMNGQIQKTYTKFSFSHQKYWIIDGTTVHLSTGNWSPSDFPEGSSFPPYAKSGESVNRDMLVVMKSPDIVQVFNEVFNNDWNMGKPWQPKSGKC